MGRRVQHRPESWRQVGQGTKEERHVTDKPDVTALQIKRPDAGAILQADEPEKVSELPVDNPREFAPDVPKWQGPAINYSDAVKKVPKLRDWVLEALARCCGTMEISHAARELWNVNLPRQSIRYLRQSHKDKILARRRIIMNDCSDLRLAHPRVRMKILEQLYMESGDLELARKLGFRIKTVAEARKHMAPARTNVFIGGDLHTQQNILNVLGGLNDAFMKRIAGSGKNK